MRTPGLSLTGPGRTRPHRRPQEGTALVIALIVVSMVAAIGAAYLQYVSIGSRTQVSHSDSIRAFYVAEAGLAESFHAVRMGRTGVIGSSANPAQHGDGLLWVEARRTSDDQVRLVSTALVGQGRSALSYVVEPVEEMVGFYSLEDLFVNSSILVDGYDSSQAGYTQQVEQAEALAASEGYEPITADMQAMMDQLASSVGLYGLLIEAMMPLPDTVSYLAEASDLEDEEEAALEEMWPDLQAAVLAGQIDMSEVQNKGCDCPVCTHTVPENPPLSAQGPTTGGGGLLASGGNIIIEPGEGELVEVFGNLMPGANGQVIGLDAISSPSDVLPRAENTEFPEVQIPNVSLQAPVQHDEALPMEVSNGVYGFESIQIATDSDLVLRGPVTVVIGQLTLEPGALLEFDTRAGNVELYISEGAQLAPGSLIQNQGADPKRSSIQVAPIATVDDPPVDLDATGAFYGMIYSPNTDVRIGSGFEIFGGTVAKQLTIAPGARLHFDSAGFGSMAIPELVSWRIVETPAAVKNSLGDPMRTLGVTAADLMPLAQSNDLDGVLITISFLDGTGNARNYSGPESTFNWNDVSEVLSVTRKPTWQAESLADAAGFNNFDSVASTEEAPPARTGVDPSVTDLMSLIDQYGFITTGSYTANVLKDLHPLTPEEWALIKPHENSMAASNWNTIVERDLAAGGTGGQ